VISIDFGAKEERKKEGKIGRRGQELEL